MKTQTFNRIGLSLMSGGYIWLWCFNRDPHVLIKYFSLQAYLFVWLFYFMSTLSINSIKIITRQELFQLSMALQLYYTPAYWALVHGLMIQAGSFPQYQINWNIAIHTVPIILLLLQLHFESLSIKFNWKILVFYNFGIGLPINLLYTKLQGPLYDFLTYETFASGYGFILASFFLQLALYFGFYLIINKLRGKNKHL